MTGEFSSEAGFGSRTESALTGGSAAFHLHIGMMPRAPGAAILTQTMSCPAYAPATERLIAEAAWPCQ